MKSQLRLHVILHIIVFVWGFTGILGKLISADQYVLVWWRTLIAFSALGIFMFFRRISFQLSRRDLLLILGTGFIIALHWIFFYGAIKISNVSVAVSCMAVASFFTAVLQPLMFRTKIVYYELLLGVGVVFGVAILVGVESDHMTGFIWGLISAFFAAMFTVINAKFVQKIDSVKISFYEMIGGFLCLCFYHIINQTLDANSLALSSADTWNLLLLGILCTAIPFVVSVWIMKQLSPYTVSISVNMEPVYTILLALLFWPEAEKMSTGFYIGLSIILLSVVLNAWLKSRKTV